jgi:hypothetical protein
MVSVNVIAMGCTLNNMCSFDLIPRQANFTFIDKTLVIFIGTRRDSLSGACVTFAYLTGLYEVQKSLVSNDIRSRTVKIVTVLI